MKTIGFLLRNVRRSTMGTITPVFQLSKPTINGPETDNAWGYDLNANFDKLDSGVQPRDGMLTALAELDSTIGLIEQIGVDAVMRRGITVSTAPPSGGKDGDLWLQYEA